MQEKKKTLLDHILAFILWIGKYMFGTAIVVLTILIIIGFFAAFGDYRERKAKAETTSVETTSQLQSRIVIGNVKEIKEIKEQR